MLTIGLTLTEKAGTFFAFYQFICLLNSFAFNNVFVGFFSRLSETFCGTSPKSDMGLQTKEQCSMLV